VSRTASTLLAAVVCAAVIAPGANATDTIDLVITSGASDDIIVNSQGSTVAAGDGKVSSSCSADFPLTIEPNGEPVQPCTLTIDADPGAVIAKWELTGAYQGEGFSFTAYPGDPSVGKVRLCWVLDGELFLGGGCTNDPPSGALAGDCAPASACPFVVSQSEPVFLDRGDGSYELHWWAPPPGESFSVHPTATVSGRNARLRANCRRAAGCRGTLQLSARLSGQGAAGSAGLCTIGEKRYRLATGVGVIRVPLRHAARRHLRSHRTVRIRATVRTRGKDGTARAKRFPLVLRK